jgi:hypothetical protein
MMHETESFITEHLTAPRGAQVTVAYVIDGDHQVAHCRGDETEDFIREGYENYPSFELTEILPYDPYREV